MRLSSLLIVFATFASAAILSLVAASLSANLIEDSSQHAVTRKLEVNGMGWAEVHAEGLQVFIAGTAPDEADRFKAISVAGGVVDAARVIDNMQVEASAEILPPRFSVEILRNESGVSLIGLMPRHSNRDAVVARIKDMSADGQITDLLETAEYDLPEGWSPALSFALDALELLPRSKISVEAGKVTVRAMGDSPAHRIELEEKLIRLAPGAISLVLDLHAPRPVITPFTLRFLIDGEDGPRFDACSADSEKARTRILTSAGKVGVDTDSDCTIGLGVPSPRWADAVEIAISGVAELGGGSVTFSDADITLVALTGTEPDLFDRVIGEMESTLPDVFALHSTLPAPPQGDEEPAGVPEFLATLSPEGLVQLRGRLRDELSRSTTLAYAHARFGSEVVYMAARLDDTLPDSWSLRVAAGLDALAQLHNGVLTMTPDALELSGVADTPEANAEISRILAQKLEQSDQFSISVSYDETLDPIAMMPQPAECIGDIQAIIKESKISFEPGSGVLNKDAGPIIDGITAILKECGDIRVEIQGYTDSQGREEMNLALSQTRATSVLNALQDRRILTSGFIAKGYGEDSPIADNKTEEGREANRRIEFVLVDSEPAESATDEGTNGATDDGAVASDAQTGEEATDNPAKDGAQEATTDDQN